MSGKLASAEIVFARRMSAHLSRGLTFVEAAAAVIDDDVRIFSALFDRRSGYFIPTADERGRTHVTPEGKGDLIASELAQTVYRALTPPAVCLGGGR